MVAPYFELKKSGDQYILNLRSTNGKVILTSHPYNSKGAAKRSIKSIQKNAPVAEIRDQT